jgi:hypothetical protein
VLLGLAGALVGFLPHNFRTRRIFLGDSGSLVIGFLLGAASLVGLTQNGVWLALPAVLALGFPLAECGITVLRRTARAMTIERARRDPERFVLKSGSPRLFTPDARHIPHRLLGLGLSKQMALAVLYGGAALLGGLAFVSVRWPWIGLWGGVAAVVILGYSATRWWYEELRLLDRGALLPLFDNQFVHRRETHAAYDAAAAAVAFLVATALTGPLHGDPLGDWLGAGIVVAATLAGLLIGGIYRASYLHAEWPKGSRRPGRRSSGRCSPGVPGSWCSARSGARRVAAVRLRVAHARGAAACCRAAAARARARHLGTRRVLIYGRGGPAARRSAPCSATPPWASCRWGSWTTTPGCTAPRCRGIRCTAGMGSCSRSSRASRQATW